MAKISDSAKQVGNLLFNMLVGAGALACVLEWLEVKPKDVRMMPWHHWMWFAAAVILFGISLFSPLRSLYILARKKEYRAGKDSAHENPNPSNPFSLTPLQVEIFKLHRDLRQLFKDAGDAPTTSPASFGPIKAGEYRFLWKNRQMATADQWTNAYAEWARKLIYSYHQKMAERVRGVMNSIGATTGMVVKPLEPFTNDIRPEDFAKLSDILLDFFVRLEGGTGLQQDQLPRPANDAHNFLGLTPYPLTLVKLGRHTPAHPSSPEVYRDKVQFVIKNSHDQQIEIWTPLWESTEVAAQSPLLSKFIKEGMEGYAGDSIEETVVKLEPSHQIEGWIGLMQPQSGDGLEIRLSRQNTGYLFFPLKVGGKMRYARLKI